MGRFVFISGGVRSGKSRYAVERAKTFPGRAAFVATAVPSDEEMRERIRLHRKARPREWDVFEEATALSPLLLRLTDAHEVVLIDCMGFFVTNLLECRLSDEEIVHRLEELADTVRGCLQTVLVVSNEVGAGIVPDNPLARRFRDIMGNVNQIMALRADEVIVMQMGIPTWLKGGGNDG